MPQFDAAAAETASAVADALAAWRLVPSAPIEQFGGMAINSNNFRVRAGDATWLCKRVGAEAHDRLTRALALAAWLAPREPAVPAPVVAHDGALTVECGGHVWCVWPFVDGDYFHGGEASVRAVGHAVGRLHAVLARAPRQLWPITRWDYVFNAGLAALEVASQREAEWDGALGTQGAGALRRRAEQLPALARTLAARIAEWGADVWQPCHGDLHPHNVLMAGEQVAAFVDVESLVVAPMPAACGFARCKLVRQAASTGGDPRGLGAAFAGALRRENPNVRHLREGAQAELLRRLLLVLHLHFVGGDSTWNHVAGMHLAGLDELDAMDEVGA